MRNIQLALPQWGWKNNRKEEKSIELKKILPLVKLWSYCEYIYYNIIDEELCSTYSNLYDIFSRTNIRIILVQYNLNFNKTYMKVMVFQKLFRTTYFLYTYLHYDSSVCREWIFFVREGFFDFSRYLQIKRRNEIPIFFNLNLV